MMNITKMETFNKRGTKKFKKEQYRKFQKKGEVVQDNNEIKTAFQVHLHLIFGFTLMGAGRQASTMKPIGRRFQVEKSVIPPFHLF